MHAMRFHEESARIADVLEHQPAHHRIERGVFKGERFMQVVEDDPHLRARDLTPGPFEHPVREVHRRDAGACFGEPGGVPAGAAAEVQHVEMADFTERVPDVRFLQRLEWIVVVIVDARPAVVTGAHTGERVTFGGHASSQSDRVQVGHRPYVRPGTAENAAGRRRSLEGSPLSAKMGGTLGVVSITEGGGGGGTNVARGPSPTWTVVGSQARSLHGRWSLVRVCMRG